MTIDNDWDQDFHDLVLTEEVKAVAESIYKKHLPEYLQEPWSRGRGKWYEDWLREQLDILVISEVCDDPGRLDELECQQEIVSLIFGIFGAAFRILDHYGMHLREQTFGQYEVLPEDVALLRELSRRFVRIKRIELGLFV